MNSAGTAVRTIQVDLPSDAFHFHPWEPRQIAEEMRALWFVEQVRERRLGYGKAAELARIPAARFIERMGMQRRLSLRLRPRGSGRGVPTMCDGGAAMARIAREL